MSLISTRRIYATLIVSAFVFSLAMFASVRPAAAQTSSSATLRGTVKDQNGAAVPNATLTLIDERTKDERKATSSDDGGYAFTAVKPATYTLKIEAPGFKTASQTNVAVETSRTRGLDVTLEVGQPAENVTVMAGAVADQLQTETGARENTITSKQIDNLSIVSRSAVELLRILPGVVAPDETDLEQVGFLSGANSTAGYHVNGLRGEQNNVTIDGARMIDFGANNGSTITANPDMVQEVNVQTSNYAAEHGSSAVQINATTKGGSSGFHGSVYDYSRSYRFQANDRSNTTSVPITARPKSQYNYPGFNFGGPIIIPGTHLNKNRDKLFFFIGYEYYYQRVDEGSFRGFVPTLKQRTGDFSELPAGSIFVPAGCTANGVSGIAGSNGAADAAPNNNIAPCADPLGKALINLYPLPNYSDAAGHNYNYSVLRPNDRNQETARIDYSISSNTKLWVKLAREYEKQGFPRGLWWDSATYELPGKLTSNNLGRSVVVNLTSVINPTMTNEVLFAGSKLALRYDYADPDKVSYKGLGLSQKVGYFPGANPYIPVSVIDNWSAELFTAYGYPIRSPYSSFHVADNLSKVWNAHTLKFGGVIERGNKTQQSNHDTDIVLGQWGQTAGTGNNFGDLFVGRPVQFSQATDRPLDKFRLYNYEFYGQDSWKVKSNITLEYGVRLGYFPQNYEQQGLGVLFDPRAYNFSQGLFINGDRTRPNGFKLAARNEIPKGVLPNPPLAWMPRLNLAWDIGGKGDWVIRAGAGMFYNRVQGNYDYYSSGQMPNTYSATVDYWGAADGITFSNLKNIDPFSAISNVNVSSRDVYSNDLPRTANFSLTIEKKLPMNNVLSVAYVGTQGRHLPQQRSVNIVPLGRLLSGTIPLSSPVTIGGTTYTSLNLSVPTQRAGLDGSVLKRFRPFNAYSQIGLYQFTGTSSYHSLQATLSHQSGKNLQYFATYTFSKALGTVATSETDGSAWADPLDTRGRTWGILPFDRTHIFNLSYNYTLPKLARGSMENWFTRGVFNGWQMSGITTFQTGTPIRLRFSGDLSNAQMALAWYGSDAFNTQGQSAGAIAPLYLRNPSLSGKSIGAKAFDISALGLPTFPNSGPAQPPFYMRTPSRSNFDVSFFKNFNFTEAKKLQFRAGFFNIFNQAYPTRFSVTDTSGGSDIYLALDTVCNEKVTVPNGNGTNTTNVCDPTKGFKFTDQTLQNFGKIQNKRGRRIVEFALKFYF